jgi:hypothetical protein
MRGHDPGCTPTARPGPFHLSLPNLIAEYFLIVHDVHGHVWGGALVFPRNIPSFGGVLLTRARDWQTAVWATATAVVAPVEGHIALGAEGVCER